jgi:hypothetical protein
VARRGREAILARAAERRSQRVRNKRMRVVGMRVRFSAHCRVVRKGVDRRREPEGSRSLAASTSPVQGGIY